MEKALFIVGTSHNAYQIRPRSAPGDGANAFKQHVLEMARKYAVQMIAEEMSEEALKGRGTVGEEVAKDANLLHLLCDPNRLERQALGILEENTPSDIEKREREWLRRLGQPCKYPILFVCGADHVHSFEQRCLDHGLVPTILTEDFDAPEIPLDRRII